MPRTTLTQDEARALGLRSGEARRARAEQRAVDQAVDLIARKAAEQRPPLTAEQRRVLVAALGDAREVAPA
jgi:hypothetical protein